MKRFKTKQEAKKLKDVHESLFNWTDRVGLWGLSSDNDPDYGHTNDVIFTKKPHPFDNLDIKCRVTPKQSKKLQKKAFKMGYHGVNDWGANVEHTDREYLCLSGNLSCNERQGITYIDIDTPPDFHSYTELTYKQFMNGSVPKKKQFKVGDCVEVISLQESQDLYIYGGRVGEVFEVVEYSGVTGYPRLQVGGKRAFLKPEQLKHTTKPKEQPLMFKGHEVEEVDVNMGDFKKFKIGCKELLKNDLRQFMEVCTTASPDATPNEIYDFLQKHQSRLL